MMQIKITLFGNLRTIYPKKPEKMTIEIEEPTSVRDILSKIEVSPLVVTKVLVNEKVVNKDFLIQKDVELELIGPLAGG